MTGAHSDRLAPTTLEDQFDSWDYDLEAFSTQAAFFGDVEPLEPHSSQDTSGQPEANGLLSTTCFQTNQSVWEVLSPLPLSLTLEFELPPTHPWAEERTRPVRATSTHLLYSTANIRGCFYKTQEPADTVSLVNGEIVRFNRSLGGFEREANASHLILKLEQPFSLSGLEQPAILSSLSYPRESPEVSSSDLNVPAVNGVVQQVAARGTDFLKVPFQRN
ncbi:hypothetical protein BDV93DRAFT_516160 [Ceratobasidium sp. AG-I]|nr:hypothetical protein BDV93DRAFT_516160 [Ceratobasidium sp. AG-I]